MNHRNLFTIIPYKNKLIKFFNPKNAFAYYLDYRINLITGEKSQYSFTRWIYKKKSKLFFETNHKIKVLILFYESGLIFEKLNEFLDPNSLLAIEIEYFFFEEYSITTIEKKIDLKLCYEISMNQYFNDFKKGFKELLEGNCYQFNLTNKFEYNFEKDLNAFHFINKLWKDPKNRGAFGNATYSSYLNQLFLSNSPECLFQIKKNRLSTMPIKGTVKLEKNNFSKTWKNLRRDFKNQSELYMISDLLRNDLSRIETPNAKIISKKLPLIVPGLLHQYSLIQVELSKKVFEFQVIKSVFPGGSITGAPKKNVMRIINQIEKRKRGFYCGSTLIYFKEMKSASINIRASTIDFKNKKLIYQSGGGITLNSDWKSEYFEMCDKKDSFINLFA